MRSEDAHLLDQVTSALNNLRAQGAPLGVDIRLVTMTINGHTVTYAFNDQNNDWDITAQ
ncbi:MAG TPA: hypothetical protein VIY48_09695 [Candidatus Paceibacterota bacterium]